MAATIDNPIYKLVIVKPSGKKYFVKNAGDNNLITDLIWSEPKGQLAQKVSCTFINIKHEGQWLNSTFDVRDRVFVYANIGEGDIEVFRGFIWDYDYKSTDAKLISFVAYDNLIYLQKSEDSVYYSAGMTTSSIFDDICNRWSMTANYSYESITHPKMPLKGRIADIFETDLLEEVKKQTGKKWVLYSEKDIIHVDYCGFNTTKYKITSKGDAISTHSTKTMSGMITKVVITGKEDDDERVPVKSTMSRNTETYGTLQKLINNPEGTELSETEAEAEEILDESSEPIRTWQVEAIDKPFLRKGHVVEVEAGNMIGDYYVLGTQHDALMKTISLDLELVK